MTDPIAFDLVLVDPNDELCEQFRAYFDEFKQVSVSCGDFEDLDRYDCIVSPANSFGLMDGGVDLAITRYFGVDVMGRVQEQIILEFRGEQPVGTAFIVETGDPGPLGWLTCPR